MKERGLMFKAPMVRAILDGRKTQTRRVINPQPPAQPEANCHPSHTWLHAEPYLDAYRNAERTTANPRGMSENWCWWQVDDRQCLPTFRSPFGKPGDRIWVRESFQPLFAEGVESPYDADYKTGKGYAVSYPATDGVVEFYDYALDETVSRVTPSIHMPRWASRITLEITNVRVERLQAISEADAIAEGVERWVVGDGWRDYSLSPAQEQAGAPAMTSARDSYRTLWQSLYGAASWDANTWVWVYEFKRATA